MGEKTKNMDIYEQLTTLFDLMSEFLEGKSKIACEIIKESTAIIKILDTNMKTYTHPKYLDNHSEGTLLKLSALLQAIRHELEEFGSEEIN